MQLEKENAVLKTELAAMRQQVRDLRAAAGAPGAGASASAASAAGAPSSGAPVPGASASGTSKAETQQLLPVVSERESGQRGF